MTATVSQHPILVLRRAAAAAAVAAMKSSLYSQDWHLSSFMWHPRWNSCCVWFAETVSNIQITPRKTTYLRTRKACNSLKPKVKPPKYGTLVATCTEARYFAGVCMSVRHTITFEIFELEISFLECGNSESTLQFRLSKSSGQGQRHTSKNNARAGGSSLIQRILLICIRLTRMWLSIIMWSANIAEQFF